MGQKTRPAEMAALRLLHIKMYATGGGGQLERQAQAERQDAGEQAVKKDSHISRKPGLRVTFCGNVTLSASGLSSRAQLHGRAKGQKEHKAGRAKDRGPESQEEIANEREGDGEGERQAPGWGSTLGPGSRARRTPPLLLPI